MRLLSVLVLGSTLCVSACASSGSGGDHYGRAPSYERTAGGALVGGAAGGMAGAVCCSSPSAGIIIGIISGALIGAAIDATYPEK